MRKLVALIVVLVLGFILIGCEQEEATLSDEEVIVVLDSMDYLVVDVVERRTVENGYEYIIVEHGQTIGVSEWIYSDELFSVGEMILAIEYVEGSVLLYDFEN